MTTGRPLRADAQRNREAILATAREVFDAEGVLVPLDAIAVRAGVGNATLYRNFPTRDDLLAAVMASNVETGLAEAAELARSLEPRAALEEWLFRLAWQLRIWHDLPYCIATSHQTTTQSAGPSEEPASSMGAVTDPLVARTDALLAQAKDAGAAIGTVGAEEVFELVTALSWAVDRFGDDEATARRRVAIATAGVFS